MALSLIHVRAAPRANYDGRKSVEAPRILWSAVTAAAFATAVAAFYLAIIASEGEGQLGSDRVFLVAASIGAAAVALVIAARPVPGRRVLLFAATLILVVWTVLGALSIGILLLPATVLAAVAATAVR
jgi:hypothetical protein